VAVDSAIHELIYDAILNKRLIRFRYQDKERIVEPHDYGIQKGIPDCSRGRSVARVVASFLVGVGSMLATCETSTYWTRRSLAIEKSQASIIGGMKYSFE
jgi:hypothetical protein